MYVTLLSNKAAVSLVITNMESKIYKLLLVGLVCSVLTPGEINYITLYTFQICIFACFKRIIDLLTIHELWKIVSLLTTQF